MPAPYYTNDEEKREFLESCRDIFAAIGYNNDQIDAHIQKLMTDESIKEQEKLYDELLPYKKKYNDNFEGLYGKYSVFKGKGKEELSRVVRGLYKPETSPENVKHNELINKKMQTDQGVVELLQEAVAALATADHKLYKGAADPRNIMDVYEPVVLGYVVYTLDRLLTDPKNKNLLTEENMPTEVIDYIHSNIRYFETAGYTSSVLDRDTSIFNIILPKDLTQKQANDAASKLYEKRSEEETKAIADVPYQRDNKFNEVKASDYIEPTDKCKAFFAKINERVEKENRDLLANEKRINSFGDGSDFIFSTVAMELNVLNYANHNEPYAIANDKALKARNDVLYAKARENFNKPLKEAVDEIFDVVNSGSIRGHKNPNYIDMLASITKIKEMVDKGTYTTEKLDKELYNLDTATYRYIGKKYQDTDRFSTRALNRIDAARLASVFARGLRSKLVEKSNEKLKNQLWYKVTENLEVDTTHEYSAKDCSMLRTDALERYSYSWAHTPENFAVFFTSMNTMKQLETSGGTISGMDLKAMIETNKLAYRELYNKSGIFKEAIDTGRFDEVMTCLPKAMEEYAKQNKAGKAEKAEVEEPEPEVEPEPQPQPEPQPVAPPEEAINEPVIDDNDLGVYLSEEEIAAQISELERIERENKAEPNNEELRFSQYGQILGKDIDELKDKIAHYNNADDIALFCYAKETLDKINLIGQVYGGKSSAMSEKLFKEYKNELNRAENVAIISDRPEFLSIVKARSGYVDAEACEEIYANYINNKSIKGMQDKINANFELDAAYTYSHTVEFDRLHTTLEARCNLLNDLSSQKGNVDKDSFAKYAATRTALVQLDSMLGLRVAGDERVEKWNKFQNSCDAKIDATTEVYKKDELLDEIIGEMGGKANFAKMYDSYVAKKVNEEEVQVEEDYEGSYELDENDLGDENIEVENEEINSPEMVAPVIVNNK